MILFYNNFITFRESVKYSINFKQELNGELSIIENNLNENDKLILKSSSYLGAFYNLNDIFKDYNIEIIKNDDKDKKDYNTIFSSQIKWRIEKYKVKSGGKNEKLSKIN